MPRLYTPFLRLKAGELDALTNLDPGLYAHLHPVLVVADQPLGALQLKKLTASLTQRAAYVWASALGSALHWSTIHQLRTHGVHAIPLVDIDRIMAHPHHAQLVGEMTAARAAGLYVPPGWTFNQPQAMAVMQLLSQAAGARSAVRVFFDVGHQTFPPVCLAGWAQSVQHWQAIRANECISFTGTSAPGAMQINGGSAGLLSVFPRAEWTAWRTFVSGNNQLTDAGFGDWGALPSGVLPINATMRQSAPKLRFAHADDWLVAKGMLAGRHGPTTPVSALAALIQQRAQVIQPAHCYACQSLSALAAGNIGAVRPGNPTTHVTWAHVHHLTVAAAQVAATP